MLKQSFRANLLALATVAAMGAVIAPSVAHAYDENSPSAVNVDAKGIGIRGFDPVAYFTAGAPAKGKAEFSASHAGVTYQFASAKNRDTFRGNPSKYAPAYGGFCAMGVVLEKKLDGDPDAWYVADGTLYLNVNKDVQKKWLEDVSGNNKKADMLWPEIKDKTPKSLN